MLTDAKRLAMTTVTALLFSHNAMAAAPTDLSISKTTSGAFTVGANGIYILTVSNVGSASTDAPITVMDNLPGSLGFVSAAGSGWTCADAGQTVTCTNPGPLAVGASSSIALRVSVSSAASPTVTNSATVSYAGDTNAANNTARRPTTVRRGHGMLSPATATPTVVPTGPGHHHAPTSTPTQTPTPTGTPVAAAATDVFVTKTVGRFFTVGADAVYTLTVTNAGPAATNAPITVTDDLPASLDFVSATGSGWTCSASEGTVTCATGDPLAVGDTSSSITLTVSVGSAAYPGVTNSATVTYAGDTNLANNTARRPTVVRAQRGPRPHTISQRPQHTLH